MLHTYTAGAVVVGPQGKILVVNQGGTSWSLPKGHIESGEDAKTAAAREIKEETGIAELEFVKKLGTYDRYKIGMHGEDDKSEYKTITMFLCSTDERELSPQDVANPYALWVKLEDVPLLLTHPKDKTFFEQVTAEINHFINHSQPA